MTTRKCGDCIHADICKQLNGGWFSRENIAYCKGFKDRKNLVEVVRCKDCMWFDTENELAGVFRKERHCYCTEVNTYVSENHFCSYGERKDNERKAD